MKQGFTQIAQQLDPLIYQRFKRALELGKWPDGRAVTKEQREICMQAVISYEEANVPEELRTGYMQQNCRSKADLASTNRSEDSEQPLNVSQSKTKD